MRVSKKDLAEAYHYTGKETKKDIAQLISN